MPLLGLVAVAIIGFQTAWTCKAFTQGYTRPQTIRGTAPTPTGLQAQPWSDPAALPRATDAASLAEGLRSMGCAAALLLAAYARGSSKSSPKFAKCRRAKVVCAAAALPCASTPAKDQKASYPSKVERVLPSSQLISLDQVTPLVPAPAASCPAPRAAAWMTALELASTACPSSAPASAARQPRPASFVGGSRRSQRRSQGSHSQSAAAAQRAARRAVGAQLLAEPRVAPEPLVLSFEPSCLREEIQKGLQLPAGMRSAYSRQTKAPAAAKGYGLNSGLYVQALHSNSLDRTKEEEQPDDFCEYDLQLALVSLGFQAAGMDMSGWCRDSGGQDWSQLRLCSIG